MGQVVRGQRKLGFSCVFFGGHWDKVYFESFDFYPVIIIPPAYRTHFHLKGSFNQKDK